MRKVVELLTVREDLVIFDSPPLQAVTDAAILGSFLDASLFVIDARQSRRRAVRVGREALAKAGANVLGAVLNRVPSRAKSDKAGYYGGYYASDEAGVVGPSLYTRPAGAPRLLGVSNARPAERRCGAIHVANRGARSADVDAKRALDVTLGSALLRIATPCSSGSRWRCGCPGIEAHSCTAPAVSAKAVRSSTVLKIRTMIEGTGGVQPDYRRRPAHHAPRSTAQALRIDELPQLVNVVVARCPSSARVPKTRLRRHVRPFHRQVFSARSRASPALRNSPSTMRPSQLVGADAEAALPGADPARKAAPGCRVPRAPDDPPRHRDPREDAPRGPILNGVGLRSDPHTGQ